jgi:hypothetical protein
LEVLGQDFAKPRKRRDFSLISLENAKMMPPTLRWPSPDRQLELPYRAPQSQTGYEQVIVTVTDQSGRYITGMQKGDFRIYVDGIQRPVQLLRRDIDTPVSVGIIVDTSGR